MVARYEVSMAHVSVSYNFHDWSESVFRPWCGYTLAILSHEPQGKNILNFTKICVHRKMLLIIPFNLSSILVHLCETRASVSVYLCDRDIDIYTLSIIFWKCTSTVQLCTSLCWSELWISTESFFDLIFWALYPNTKSIESITLDFPLPFGPMMQEKRWEKGKRKHLKII